MHFARARRPRPSITLLLSLPGLVLWVRPAQAEDDPVSHTVCPEVGPAGQPWDEPPLAVPAGVSLVSSTIFVNYDGAELTGGQDHAPSNTTQISQCVGTLDPYGAGAKREASFQALAGHYAPFELAVTSTRPDLASYAMVVVTPTNPFPFAVGVSPVDCGDSNPDSVSFAFVSEGDALSAALQGSVMAHELGHAFGLNHVHDKGNIMNRSANQGVMVFKDECTQIDGSNQCSAIHQQHCGIGQQNTYQELLGLFGPAVPDLSPPTVQIIQPGDGDTFEVGASFTVAAEAEDDKGVVQVELYVNDFLEATDEGEPWEWDVTDVPEGTHSLYLLAVDAAGNEAASQTVTIQVGDPGATGSGSGGSTTSTGGGAETTGDTGSTGGADDSGATGSGGDHPSSPQDDAHGGCGCAIPNRREGAWWLLLPALSLARRRTRPSGRGSLTPPGSACTARRPRSAPGS